MFKHKCEKCGKEFETKKKEQKYCSRKCVAAVMATKRKIHVCIHCGKKFERTKRKKDACIFCSRDCSFKYLRQQKEKKEQLKIQEKEKKIEKVCKHCGEKFLTDNKAKIYCSEDCLREVGREKARKNKEEQYKPKKFVCKYCGKEVTTQFGNKYRGYCDAECSKKHLNGFSKHKRRALINKKCDKDISLVKLYKKHKGLCVQCGTVCDYEDYKINAEGYFVSGDNYPSIDHIIPLSKGGTHTHDNVQLMCRRCNSEKGDKSRA